MNTLFEVVTEKLTDSTGPVGMKSVRRADDKSLLGVVSNERAIVQPSELMDGFRDDCTWMGADESGITVKELHGGAKLHFEANAPGVGEFAVKACLRASFDSTERRRLFWRFIDEEGNSFVGGELASAKFTKNHSLNWMERDCEAEQALTVYPSELAKKLEDLKNKRISPQKLQSLVLAFIGKGGSKRKDNERSGFKSLVSDVSTGYGFFKACLRWNNTERSFKKTEKVSREENRFLALTSENIDGLIDLILK